MPLPDPVDGGVDGNFGARPTRGPEQGCQPTLGKASLASTAKKKPRKRGFAHPRGLTNSKGADKQGPLAETEGFEPSMEF